MTSPFHDSRERVISRDGESSLKSSWESSHKSSWGVTERGNKYEVEIISHVDNIYKYTSTISCTNDFSWAFLWYVRSWTSIGRSRESQDTMTILKSTDSVHNVKKYISISKLRDHEMMHSPPDGTVKHLQWNGQKICRIFLERVIFLGFSRTWIWIHSDVWGCGLCASQWLQSAN